jgi:hypothetical protein
MSIAISESTEDDRFLRTQVSKDTVRGKEGANAKIAENGLVNGSGNVRIGDGGDNWDAESGVLPPELRNLNSKASSTLLGRQYSESGETDSVERRLRNERSSSTLRSYYDRKNAPLTVSQQTSNSSARDMALRKGHPPVLGAFPRSPLLQVDSIDDANTAKEYGFFQVQSNQASKSKPSRLNISKYFHKNRKEALQLNSPEDLVRSPSSISQNTDASATRRKLMKSPKKSAIAPTQDFYKQEKSVQFKSATISQGLYQHYEERAFQSPGTSPQIPQEPSRLPTRHPEPRFDEYMRVQEMRQEELRQEDEARRQEQLRQQHSRQEECKRQEEQLRHVDEEISPKAQRSHMHKDYQNYHSTQNQYLQPHGQEIDDESSWKPPPHPWDVRSATSASSRATKTSSRKSVFSNSDLHNNSILSLSSDSDSDTPSTQPQPSQAPSRPKFQSHNRRPSTSPGPPQDRQRQSTQPMNIDASLPQRKRSNTSRSPRSPTSPAGNQDENFLTIPLPSPMSTRLSGPWTPLKDLPTSPTTDPRSARTSRQSRGSQSTVTERSRQSSLPKSEHSVAGSLEEKERDKRHSNRLMAVTSQEQALLSALRSKRTLMRDQIIAENASAFIPPESGPPTSELPNPPTAPSQSSSHSESSAGSRSGSGRERGGGRVQERVKKSRSRDDLRLSMLNNLQLPGPHGARVVADSNSRNFSHPSPPLQTNFPTPPGWNSHSGGRNFPHSAFPSPPIHQGQNQLSQHNQSSHGSQGTAQSLGSQPQIQPQSKGKERILLYLDRPLPPHIPGSPHTGIDTAEPSPDLSDFLSFGSDDEDGETPRSSWFPGTGHEGRNGVIVEEDETVGEFGGEEIGTMDEGLHEDRYKGEGRPRPDSVITRRRARLSAVGMPVPRGVKVVSEGGTEDEEVEVGVIWGM